MIRRMNGSETLLHRTLPTNLGVEVLEWAAERDLHARVFVDGGIITSPDTPPPSGTYRRSGEPGVSVVDSPADWLREHGEEPTKLVLVDWPEAVESGSKRHSSAFAGRLFVTRSLPHYVEVGGLKAPSPRALGSSAGGGG